jgi:Peroxisomal biogenesis factor 11 (PEX11)
LSCNNLVGRDKVLRLIQYFSRFYAWYLFRTNHPQASITPWATAKKQIGITRKMLRVGKFVEHFKAAAVAADAKSTDPVLKTLAVSRQIGYAGYLTFDNLCIVSWTLDELSRVVLMGILPNSSMLRESRSGKRPRISPEMQHDSGCLD